jgi:hypothetical protein
VRACVRACQGRACVCADDDKHHSGSRVLRSHVALSPQGRRTWRRRSDRGGSRAGNAGTAGRMDRQLSRWGHYRWCAFITCRNVKRLPVRHAPGRRRIRTLLEELPVVPPAGGASEVALTDLAQVFGCLLVVRRGLRGFTHSAVRRSVSARPEVVRVADGARNGDRAPVGAPRSACRVCGGACRGGRASANGGGATGAREEFTCVGG